MRARGLLIAIVATFVSACGRRTDDDDETEATPIARVTTTTTTTTTEVQRPALTYDAELLDGGTMTIEEGVGELSEFTQGKPTAIYELDLLAAIPDCEQLGLSIWDWTTKAGPTDAGQKASAYAKHGDNLYKFIGCGTSAQPEPPTRQTSIRASTRAKRPTMPGTSTIGGASILSTSGTTTPTATVSSAKVDSATEKSRTLMFECGHGWEHVAVAGGRPSIAPGPPFGPGRPPRHSFPADGLVRR